MTEMPLESPIEDVAEQRTDAYGDGLVAGAGTGPEPEIGLETDPADARDQAAEVPLDEEEWG